MEFHHWCPLKSCWFLVQHSKHCSELPRRLYNCVRESHAFLFLQLGCWQYSSDCGFGQTMALWFETLGQWLLPEQTFQLCVPVRWMARDGVGILPMNRPALGGFCLSLSGLLFCFIFLPIVPSVFPFSRNSCAAVEFLIETQLENRSAQALFISLIAWWWITRLHSLIPSLVITWEVRFVI